MKKLLVVIMIMMLVLASFTGCGKKEEAKDLTDKEYVVQKGTMVVGITDFEPMDFQDASGKWVGFDADLANAVGEKLGVKIEFQEINWSTKETELAAKTIDCIWNGLTYTEDRAKEMAMSDYYMINKQVLVVKKDNAADYADPEKIKSVKIAVESGSAGEDAALAVTDEKNVVSAELQLDALLEVLASTADAAIIDGVMAAYLTNKADSDFNKLVIVEGALDVEDEYYSIAFRKGSDLAVSVNDIIKGMKADGTVKKIADKYGLADVLVG